MNTLYKTVALCLAVLVLTGCFPSERKYVIKECSPATSGLCGLMPPNSEIAFVKNSSGPNYKIWINQKPDLTNGPMLVLPDCEAPVSSNKFECAHCGPPKSLKIAPVSGSDCGFDKCVSIDANTTTGCPAGGTAKGGHN